MNAPTFYDHLADALTEAMTVLEDRALLYGMALPVCMLLAVW